MRGVHARDVGRVLENECLTKLHRPLERDLGNPAPGRTEPALAHQKLTGSPGSGAITSTPGGASSRNASGVPLKSGKVP